jgi:hypothetical protein
LALLKLSLIRESELKYRYHEVSDIDVNTFYAVEPFPPVPKPALGSTFDIVMGVVADASWMMPERARWYLKTLEVCVPHFVETNDPNRRDPLVDQWIETQNKVYGVMKAKLMHMENLCEATDRLSVVSTKILEAGLPMIRRVLNGEKESLLLNRFEKDLSYRVIVSGVQSVRVLIRTLKTLVVEKKRQPKVIFFRPANSNMQAGMLTTRILR